ncbi:MAG: hypothetical protein IT236_03560 [Bacteroidia bacterium]|nr:hypothetical protein [Bacteroidia bacterium]
MLTNLYSQKYNFVNWTVEDGLIQSQASFICQDSYRQLWIGTEGGICKFDGKKFTGYSVQEGLINNHINQLYCAANGNLWIGTSYGASVFNGRSFKNIRLSASSINNVLGFCETNDSAMLALNNFKCYRIKQFVAEKICLSGDTAERVTAFYKCKNGAVLAAVYGKGIYQYANKTTCTKLFSPEEPYNKGFVRSLFISSNNDTHLIINNNLFSIKLGKLTIVKTKLPGFENANVLCMAEDSKSRLWLGSDEGAYRIDGEEIIHFNSKSGLTDNSVNHIYKDSENNLWFATDADGIYKFRENTFTYFDKSSGLVNPIFMGVTQTKQGTIYAGGYGGGLFQINTSGKLEPVIHKGPVLQNSKIYCVYADNTDDETVWIGTIANGVWKYNKKKGAHRLVASNDSALQLWGANVLFNDKPGSLIIASNQGLFVKNKDDEISSVKIPGNAVATAIMRFDNDSILIGTSKGLFYLNKNYQIHAVKSKELNNEYILCLAQQHNNILIGTPDKGVLNWNIGSGEILHYTTSNGLPSNFIYSIYFSPDERAWIGTGFGICNLQLNSKMQIEAIKNYGRSDGLLGMECSHNCVLPAKDSSLWFGTTKGLFHFYPYINIAEKNAPFIFLRSVKLFSSDIEDSTLFTNTETWFKVPHGLKLNSKQNHITFELGSVYHTNPEDVIYKYKLEGIDKDYTTSNNPVIIYPALPPGIYTLKVTGLTKNGVVSLNTVEYVFEIEKAFYQTRVFQLVVVLLLLLTGGLIAYFLTRGRQKRKQKAKELLEKIREEEFIKLRQRTAEDFHDEMGNSLTRISVLTDMLRSKLLNSDTEVNKLVAQIKENTTKLYNGSKDIIWSLNSKNDGLFEITEHIREIGIELFSETKVEFVFKHNITKINSRKLKLDYSRNLSMIFKEAYNNCLKYAAAGLVDVEVELNSDNELRISIKDNGTGFNPETVHNGNGLKNMSNRAKRMNGELTINSAPGKGTHININLKNIFI